MVRITAAEEHGGGAAFAQFPHKHTTYGALHRVLGPAPPGTDAILASEVAARPTQFVTFFPLGSACHRGIAEILGEAPIPVDAQRFPVFRAATHAPAGPGPWWLRDGEKEWRIGQLAPSQRALPVREIVNDTLLVQRAREGWTAEQDV